MKFQDPGTWTTQDFKGSTLAVVFGLVFLPGWVQMILYQKRMTNLWRSVFFSKPDLVMAIQPAPPLTYPPQKSGFTKALLRESNGFS